MASKFFISGERSEGSKEVKVTGIVVLVSFYKNGIVFHLIKSRYKRVYVSFDLLKKKGLYYGKSEVFNDLDLTISFAGKCLVATGTFISWYGGVCKTYVDAKDFDFTDRLFHLPEKIFSKNLSEVSEAIKTVFKEVGLKSFDNSEVFDRIAVDPSFVFKFCERYDVEKGKVLIDFPLGLMIYKVLNSVRSKAKDFVYLPLVAFKPAAIWFYQEQYENGRFLACFKDLLSTFKNLMIPVNENDLFYFVNLLKTDGSFKLFSKGSPIFSVETLVSLPLLENLYYVTEEVYSKVKYTITSLHKKATEKHLMDYNLIEEFFVKGGLSSKEDEKPEEENVQITSEELFKLLKQKKVFVLYGPGGTGKTTLLKNLLKVAGSHGILCQYVTLTAKQARRFPGGRTLADLIRKGSSPVDFTFVDETSTLNLDMLCSLLRKCKKSSIVFVGDPEQSPPPIGPSVFDCLLLPFLKEKGLALKLTRVYRYDKRRLYKKVYCNFDEAYKWIKLLISRAKSQGYSYVVTTGIHDSMLGTKGLNLFLKTLEKEGDVDLKEVVRRYKTSDFSPEVGDLVMVVKNLVVNQTKIPRGTLGRVISRNSTRVEVEFGDFVKKVFPLNLSDVALGYALEYYSVQGGEADVCIAVIPTTKIIKENFIKKWNVITSRARICTVLLMPQAVEKKLSLLFQSPSFSIISEK